MKGIYTSILTLVELALVSVRKGIPVEGMIASVLSIAELKGANKSNILAAAHLIDHEKMECLTLYMLHCVQTK